MTPIRTTVTHPRAGLILVTWTAPDGETLDKSAIFPGLADTYSEEMEALGLAHVTYSAWDLGITWITVAFTWDWEPAPLDLYHR